MNDISMLGGVDSAWDLSATCALVTQCLLHFLWQGTVIAAIVWLVCSMLGQRSAHRRYAVSLGGLMLMAVVPIATSLWISLAAEQPVQSVEARGDADLAVGTSLTVPLLAPDVANRLPGAGSKQLELSATPAPVLYSNFSTAGHASPSTFDRESLSWLNVIELTATGLYVVGLLLMLGRLVLATAEGRRLRIDSTPSDDARLLAMVRRQSDRLGLKIMPAIAVCSRIAAPAVVGLLKPTILLPTAFVSGLHPREIEAILTHEMAHIRRHDLWVHVLQRCIESALFFHPGVWYVSRRVSLYREQCCDDAVIACGHSRASYATTLIRLAERYQESQMSRHGNTSVVALSAIGDRPSAFKMRVMRLIEPEPRLRPSGGGVSAVIGACVLSVVVFALSSSSVTQAQAGPQTASESSVDDDGPVSTVLTSEVANISGRILNEPSGGQVEINVGDNDGIRAGYRFDVIRDGQRVGIIEAVEVFADASRCFATDEVHAGDSFELLRRFDVAGVCVDENDEPLEGIEVQIYRRSANRLDPSVLIAEIETDAGGRYSFTNIPTIQQRDYASDLILIASRKGYTSRIVDLMANAEDLRLELGTKEGNLVGIVFDPDGNPLASAVVRVRSGWNLPGYLIATTDDQGKYEIGGLRPFEKPERNRTHSTLLVSHSGYGDTLEWYTSVPQMVNVIMELPAIVQGKVIDGVSGQPASHVMVLARGVTDQESYQTWTDEEGRYELKMTSDLYDIWAEMNGRIAIAIDSALAFKGETTLGPEITMVEGAMIHGLYTDGQTGEAVQASFDPYGRGFTVGHYGPARPHSGGAGITAMARVAPDGSYRLRVAPGANYLYLSSGNASANIEVEDGGDYTLHFTSGRSEPKPSDSRVRLVMRRVLREAQANLAPPSRDRGPTAVGGLLDQLEFHNSGELRYSERRLAVLHQIVMLGRNAVPELCRELELTDDDSMIRCMAFALRAIGDPRAVPALIQAIPKTLRGSGSDMGLRVGDEKLERFAQQHDLDEDDLPGQYGIGRPVREVFGALQRLTGHQIEDNQLFSVFRAGTDQQLLMKQRLFARQAHAWANWWKGNANRFDISEAYRPVDLAPLPRVTGPIPIRRSTRYNTAGRTSNAMLEAASDPQASIVFLDFDTGRNSPLPERWRDDVANLPQADIDAWATDQGFDLVGTKVATGQGDQSVYAIRLLGTKAWELGEDRWKMHSNLVTLGELMNEGREVTDDYLLRTTDEGVTDHEGIATFLIVTREGTPGIIFVGIQVIDDSLQRGDTYDGDNELNPKSFRRKGRRFGFTLLEELR